MLSAKPPFIDMTRTDTVAVFDPSLRPVFSDAKTEIEHHRISHPRDLFYALIHAGEHSQTSACAYRFLTGHLERVKTDCGKDFSEHVTSDAVRDLMIKPDFESFGAVPRSKANEVWLHYAPVRLTELSWLPSLFQTATCREPLAVDLTALYLQLTEQGQSASEIGIAYTAFLQTFGRTIPAVHSRDFSQNAEFSDESFDLAAVQLALSRFPRVCLAEILGFTLASCHARNIVEICLPDQSAGDLPSFFIIGTQRRKQAVAAMTQIIECYLGIFQDQRNRLWQRIQSGYRLQRLLTHRLSRQIADRCQAEPSSVQAMDKLLQRLSVHAAGHHGNVRLGSKTIDEWFRSRPFQSEQFLTCLLQSTWVDKDKPEQSKLLKLFEFNGPMFGVLDESDIIIVKNWLSAELAPDKILGRRSRQTTLASSNATGESKKTPGNPAIRADFEMSAPLNGVDRQPDFTKIGSDRLFYYLINRDIYPGIVESAKKKVTTVLAYARLFNRAPFAHYSHTAFENVVESIYRRETNRYRPLDRQPQLSRASYVWGIEQWAPTILTDGSWLQSAYRLELSPSYRIAGWLNAIYLDEIGKGRLAQNHPHIYRHLLDSVGIHVPPVTSEAFAAYPGFVTGAFDIPVYLMAIAVFPDDFLPELLGLNLAIELSGLGNQYLRLSQALRYWGIDSTIVDIHTSIDNLATGHAALAKKAVRNYLDDIAAGAGAAAADRHWRRIYTGFCSLQTAAFRFKFSLIREYFLHKPAARSYSYDNG